MKHQGSLPYTQLPATRPYPEPDRSSPYPYIPLSEDPSYYYPPIYAWVYKAASFPQVSPPKPCIHPMLSPIRATCPAHLILPNLITRKNKTNKHILQRASRWVCEFKNKRLDFSQTQLLYFVYKDDNMFWPEMPSLQKIKKIRYNAVQINLSCTAFCHFSQQNKVVGF